MLTRVAPVVDWPPRKRGRAETIRACHWFRCNSRTQAAIASAAEEGTDSVPRCTLAPRENAEQAKDHRRWGRARTPIGKWTGCASTGIVRAPLRGARRG